MRSENESLRVRVGELEADLVKMNGKLSSEKEHVSNFRANVNSIIKEYHDMTSDATKISTVSSVEAAADQSDSTKEETKSGKIIHFNLSASEATTIKQNKTNPREKKNISTEVASFFSNIYVKVGDLSIK